MSQASSCTFMINCVYIFCIDWRALPAPSLPTARLSSPRGRLRNLPPSASVFPVAILTPAGVCLLIARLDLETIQITSVACSVM